MDERAPAARGSDEALMRLLSLTAVLVASVPRLVSAAEPAARGAPIADSSVIDFMEHGRGLLVVERLRTPDFDEVIAVRSFQLTLPSMVSKMRDATLGFSPDVPLEGTSLTLRLIPTRRAPSADEPIVLLPRVAGVGSRWFGLDFAAWF